MSSLLDLPDELLLLIRDHLPITLEQHLAYSHLSTRFLRLSSEASWRSLLFKLKFGRPLCNHEEGTGRGRRPEWRRLALALLGHNKRCPRAGCKDAGFLDIDKKVPNMETVLTDASVFRFHPLHFTVHGHPTSTPVADTPLLVGASASASTVNTTSQPPNPDAPSTEAPQPPARVHLPAYTLTLPRVLQAHLPFPSWPGRAPASLLSLSSQYGPTQRYAPLCHHPNASCVFVTDPPCQELKLPFWICGERRVVSVSNDEGVTLLDLSRALVNAVLAEPDDIVLNTVMETYGARDDIVSFGLVQALRDRGFMNDHEWPLIELLDEYDYGETSWDGYTTWVDNVRGATLKLQIPTPMRGKLERES